MENNVLEYNDLFQDKLIFESIGQGRYYDQLYPEIVKERNKKWTRFIKPLMNALQVCHMVDKNKKNVLFLEHRFAMIADILSEDYNIFLLHDSISIYKCFVKKKYSQFFYRDWMKLVDKSFISHDMQYAARAMKKAQHYLKKNNIDLVFVGNDKRFMERLLLKAANNENIPSVVIQHGIYTDEWSFEKLKTANTADQFWAWSQYIKDCYVKRFHKKENQVTVIGYPFELLKDSPKDTSAVLFLGNNYKNTNIEEGQEYLEIAKNVLQLCEKLGVKYSYRAHPGEIIDETYGQITGHIHKGNTLLQDLDAVGIVIGDVSSAMIEAGLCGRKVIQIIWSSRSKDTVDDPLYAFTLKVTKDPSEIENAIKSCIMDQATISVNEYYMFRDSNMRDNIKKHVSDVIERNQNGVSQNMG